jgi:hypothetical protein
MSDYWELFTAHSVQYINPLLGWQVSFLEFWPLKMGPIGCPETSVRNYPYSLGNNPEERSPYRDICALWDEYVTKISFCASVYCNFEIGTEQIWRRIVGRCLQRHLSGEFYLALDGTNVARVDLCRLSKQDCTSRTPDVVHGLYESVFHFQVSYVTRYIRQCSLIYTREKRMVCPIPNLTKRRCVQIPCTEFYPNWTKYVQNFIYCRK